MASKHECRSALLVIIEFTSCSDNHFSSDNKFKRLTNRIAKDGKWALNNTIGRKNKIGNCYLYVTLWRELYVYRNIHTCWQRYIYICVHVSVMVKSGNNINIPLHWGKY